MARSQKFKAPVFTRRPGGKHTEHDAGWLDSIVSAVKAGTPAALKRLAIAYHGIAPHYQDDLSGPIVARPSVMPTEPQDVPGADDQVRTLAPGNVPNAFGMRNRSHEGGTVPTKG
jgi:hypothetical protein